MHTETRWKSEISITDKQEDEAKKKKKKNTTTTTNLQLAEMKRAHNLLGEKETVLRWRNLSVGRRCNHLDQAKFLY